LEKKVRESEEILELSKKESEIEREKWESEKKKV
jgi:hypothetical protein